MALFIVFFSIYLFFRKLVFYLTDCNESIAHAKGQKKNNKKNEQSLFFIQYNIKYINTLCSSNTVEQCGQHQDFKSRISKFLSLPVMF